MGARSGVRETELNELLTNAIINNCNSNKIYCVNWTAVATSSASRSQSWLPSQPPSHCSRCRRRRQRQRRGVFSYVVFFLCINNYDEETLRKTKLKQRRAMNEWPNNEQSQSTTTTTSRTTTSATTMTGRQAAATKTTTTALETCFARRRQRRSFILCLAVVLVVVFVVAAACCCSYSSSPLLVVAWLVALLLAQPGRLCAQPVSLCVCVYSMCAWHDPLRCLRRSRCGFALLFFCPTVQICNRKVRSPFCIKNSTATTVIAAAAESFGSAVYHLQSSSDCDADCALAWLTDCLTDCRPVKFVRATDRLYFGHFTPLHSTQLNSCSVHSFAVAAAVDASLPLSEILFVLFFVCVCLCVLSFAFIITRSSVADLWFRYLVGFSAAVVPLPLSLSLPLSLPSVCCLSLCPSVPQSPHLASSLLHCPVVRARLSFKFCDAAAVVVAVAAAAVGGGFVSFLADCFAHSPLPALPPLASFVCSPCPAHFQLVLGVRAVQCFFFILFNLFRWFLLWPPSRFLMSVCVCVFVCLCAPVCVYKFVISCCVVAATTSSSRLPSAVASSLSFRTFGSPSLHTASHYHRHPHHHRCPSFVSVLSPPCFINPSHIFEAFVMNSFSCLILVIYLLLALFRYVFKPFSR